MGFLVRRHFGRLILATAGLALVSSGIVAVPAAQAVGDDQLVRISIDANGAVKAVEGANEKKIDPTAVNKDFPIRVLTSYTAQGKSSSSAKVVTGASGQVRINISVQNTTGHLQVVSANVNGRSVQRAEMITTPYSVVASVKLPGVKPADVMLQTEKNEGLTNGVVGVDKTGTTYVQWAGISGLNPGATVVNFSLVLNATNFQAPTIELASQPGFGLNADPQQQRAESELTTSTMKALQDASKVLADSGKSIDEARSTLSAAGDQVGKKTIQDLQTSNQRVATSAKSVATTLNSLNSRLDSTFKATGSEVIGELALVTSQVSQLLGNPDEIRSSSNNNAGSSRTCAELQGSLSKAAKNNSGEATGQVKPAKSIAEVINGMTDTLALLSETTGSCQKELSGELAAIFGPANPTAEVCKDNQSLACMNLSIENSMRDIFNRNLNQIKTASNNFQKVQQDYDSAKIESVRIATTALLAANSNLQQYSQDVDARKIMVKIKQDAVEVGNAAQNAKTNLEKYLTAIDSDLKVVEDNAGKEKERLKNLRKDICVNSGLTADTSGVPSTGSWNIPKQDLDKLIGGLFEYGCPATVDKLDADPGPQNPGAMPGQPSVEAQVIQRENEIKKIRKKLSPDQDAFSVDGYKDLQADLKSIVTKAGEIENDAQTYLNKTDTSDPTLSNIQKDIDNKVNDVKTASEHLSTESNDLVGKLKPLEDELNNYVKDTEQNLGGDVTKVKTENENKINQSRTKVNDSVSASFDSVQQLLDVQAGELGGSGKEIVGKTRESISQSNAALANRTAQQTVQNSQLVQTVIGKAMIDSTAASVQLSADIARILQDIGAGGRSGGGLLGAIASSHAQLGITNAKISDSTTRTAKSQGQQRENLADQIFNQQVTRASLARLENLAGETPGGFSAPVDLYSFTIGGTGGSQR